MSAYSIDLRQRGLAAVDLGMLRPEIVQTFQVSLATLKRYLKQRRETGVLMPKLLPGRPVHKSPALRAGLPPLLTTTPDATLMELCDRWKPSLVFAPARRR